MNSIKRLHLRELQPYFTSNSGIKRIARAKRLDINKLNSQALTNSQDDKKQTRQIENPQHYIACVLLAKNGQLDNHDREVLYVSHVLSHKWNQCAVIALVFGKIHQDLGEWGADSTITVEYDLLEHYQPSFMVDQIELIIEQYQPKHLLFADNDWGGGDLIRRLAARKGDATPATEVIEIDENKVVRLTGNQGQEASRKLPFLIGLLEATADTNLNVICQSQNSSVADIMTTTKTELYSKVDKIPSQEIPLEQARLVISLGNGVDNVESFLRCSQALGATVAGSRVVVDDGKLPRDRQVGATGTRTAASVYLAFGISGALQHLEGIQKCNTVIAINTDESCPMVSRADYSYINDAVEVLNALTEIAKAHKQKQVAA